MMPVPEGRAQTETQVTHATAQRACSTKVIVPIGRSRRGRDRRQVLLVTSRAQDHRRRRRRRVHGRPDDFVVVLWLLGVSYLLFAVTSDRRVRVLVALIYVVALVVTVQASDPTSRQRRAMRWLVACGLVVAGAGFLVLPVEDAQGVVDVMVTAVLALTLVLVVSRVLLHRTVTIQTIAGALSAYLLIGMTFTSLYAVLAWVGPDPFFVSSASQAAPDLQYFSFTTLTTLGYGDLTVTTGAARGFATLEALVGQIFLATLVASLVAAFRMQEQALDDPVVPDGPGGPEDPVGRDDGRPA